MSVFRRLLMLSGGGTSVPYDYPDKFAFFADSAVIEPSVLQVLRPDDRLGDFTVVRASNASYTDSSGVIQTAPDNVARIDYTNGVAELLTEPQSTNLITYSEDFSDVSWVKNAGGVNTVAPIVTPNSVISPDGTQNADAILFEANGTTISDSSNLINTLSTTTTSLLSFWVKALDGDSHIMRVYASGEYLFDVTTEWNRVEIFITSTSLPNFQIQLNSVYETGTANVSLWGAQLEALPYATSYIPTNGSTVTRLQDVIADGGNVNVINSEEGTMFFKGSALFDDGTWRYITASDGSDLNRVIVAYNDTSDIYSSVRVAQANVFDASPDQVQVDNVKIAIKWKLNDFATWVNGVEVGSIGAGVVFPIGTLNTVNLSDATGTGVFFGRTRELKVYNKALPDSQLEYITTL